MNYEQVIKLALVERKLVNAFAANVKFTSVKGQGLWPRAETHITCKNYNRKAIVPACKQSSHRAKPEGNVVRMVQVTSELSNHYLTLLAGISKQRTTAMLIGEARR